MGAANHSAWSAGQGFAEIALAFFGAERQEF